jgi:hypothetical protein
MTQLYLNTDGDYLIVNSTADWLLTDEQTANSYPTTPAPLEATITSYAPSFISVTHGLARQVRTRNAQLWQIELRYAGMTRAAFMPLWAFLTKQAGQAGTFDVTLTGLPRLGAGGGTPLVNGNGQTGTSLITDGWPNSTTVLKAGDFFSIAGDNKVYQATADVASNGSGQATISLYPSLRRIAYDNSAINAAPTFRCSLMADTLGVDWNQCALALGFAVGLIESP